MSLSYKIQGCLITGLILVMMIYGCAVLHRIKPPTVLKKITPYELISRVNLPIEEISSMTGSGRLRVDWDELSHSADFIILYREPAQLRIDLYTVWGQYLLSCVINQDIIIIYDNFQNRWYKVVPSADGYFNNTEELIRLFLGGIAGFHDLSASVKTDRNKYLISYTDERYHYKFWIEPQRYVVNQYSLVRYDNLTELYTTYNNFSQINGKWRATYIKVVMPLTNRAIELRFEQQVINDEIHDNAFNLEQPDSIEVININDILK